MSSIARERAKAASGTGGRAEVGSIARGPTGTGSVAGERVETSSGARRHTETAPVTGHRTHSAPATRNRTQSAPDALGREAAHGTPHLWNATLATTGPSVLLRVKKAARPEGQTAWSPAAGPRASEETRGPQPATCNSCYGLRTPPPDRRACNRPPLADVAQTRGGRF